MKASTLAAAAGSAIAVSCATAQQIQTIFEPKPKPEPINNAEIVEQFRDQGGQIVHIVPKRLPNGKWTRGITVAFKRLSGHVEVATAVQHRSDTFSKKMGTKIAIEHFIDGRTINLPARTADRHYSTAESIKSFLPFIG